VRTYQTTIHTRGPALWPDHKPAAEIIKLRDTTPPLIWEGTYQGNPTPAGGYTFRREWWSGRNRYTAIGYAGKVVARCQSWDTSEGDNDESAFSVCVTLDILADYRIVVREVYRDRLTFDVLPESIESMARQANYDGLLRHVVIEDKSSGRSANQTLRARSPEWLRLLLHPYMPAGSKEMRAGAASVWCRNGMILLPEPGPGAEWLMDFEDELFSFPQSAYKDQVDAFAQALLFLENYLSAGWTARRGGQ